MAVAAFFKAGNDLTEMGGAAITADDVMVDNNNEMQMVWHDDIVLDFDHGIMGADAIQQFVLDHHADVRKKNSWCVRISVGLAGISNEMAQGLLLAFSYADGNVVGAGPTVVLLAASPAHVLIDVVCLVGHDKVMFFINYDEAGG